LVEKAIPVSISRSPRSQKTLAEETLAEEAWAEKAMAEPSAKLASSLGQAAFALLSYLIGVIDREDRLESGTGLFKQELSDDPEARRRAVEDSVLRTLRMAVDPDNFHMLEILARSSHATTSFLSTNIGLPRLAVEERISDLVSAGLAAKVFASGQVAATDIGGALVGLIREAVAAGAAFFEEER
jgi:hypothetical protein